MYYPFKFVNLFESPIIDYLEPPRYLNLFRTIQYPYPSLLLFPSQILFNPFLNDRHTILNNFMFKVNEELVDTHSAIVGND